jgi:hypothetical protein
LLKGKGDSLGLLLAEQRGREMKGNERGQLSGKEVGEYETHKEGSEQSRGRTQQQQSVSVSVKDEENKLREEKEEKRLLLLPHSLNLRGDC